MTSDGDVSASFVNCGIICVVCEAVANTFPETIVGFCGLGLGLNSVGQWKESFGNSYEIFFCHSCLFGFIK